jgi:hypothetical protein
MTDKSVVLCGFGIGMLGFVFLGLGLVLNSSAVMLSSGQLFVGGIIVTIVGKRL